MRSGYLIVLASNQTLHPSRSRPRGAAVRTIGSLNQYTRYESECSSSSYCASIAIEGLKDIVSVRNNLMGLGYEQAARRKEEKTKSH